MGARKLGEYVFNGSDTKEDAFDALQSIANGWPKGNVAGFRSVGDRRDGPGLKLLFQSLLLFLRFGSSASINPTELRSVMRKIAAAQQIDIVSVQRAGQRPSPKPKDAVDEILSSLIAERGTVAASVTGKEDAFFSVAVLLVDRHLAHAAEPPGSEQTGLADIGTGAASPVEKSLCGAMWQAAKELDDFDVRAIHQCFASLLGVSDVGARAALTYRAAILHDLKPSAERHARHVISDGFNDYLPYGDHADRQNEERLVDEAQRIVDHLTRRAGRSKPVALLQGSLDAGKSGVVVEVLRRCVQQVPRQRAYDLELKLETSKTTLPVFEVDIQDFSNREITLRVLAFLKRLKTQKDRQGRWEPYEASLDGARKEYTSKWKIRATEDLRDEIADLHSDFEAFFIFSNWDDFGWSSQRAQLRDMANAALIRCLTKSNARSRILVTAVGSPSYPDISRIGPHERFVLPNPRFDQLGRYCRFKYPEPFAQHLNSAKRRLSDTEIPGSHLILLMAALHLCMPWEGEDAEDLATRGREVIDSFSAALSGAQTDLTTITPVVHLICDRLYERDLFAIAMAIAASDDGLHPGSLLHVIRNWKTPQKTSLLLATPGFKIENYLDTSFGSIASGFFIRDKKPTEKNSDQFSYDEDGEVDKPLWEMHQTVRELILTVIADPANKWAERYRELAREAERKVAALAHHRSALWRAQGYATNLTPRWKDYARDIQVVEGLLASIPPEGLSNTKRNRAARQSHALLRQSTDAVFVTDAGFEPAVALRFAALAVLRDCLDWNHRMSMVFDQDRTRARLYFLIWADLGKKHFWPLDTLGSEAGLDLTTMKLPPYAESCFTVGERLELLESLALASFHSMQEKLAKWARKQAEDLVATARATRAGRRALCGHRTKFARIRCAAFDMAVLKGGPLNLSVKDGELKGHNATLQRIRSVLGSEEFKRYEAAFNVESRQELDRACRGPRDELVAWLHLKSREAYVSGLIGGLENAWPMYRRIHEVEGLLADRTGTALPAVLIGRPARLFMELPIRSYHGSRDASGAVDWLDREQKALMRGIIETNQARLTRFGGGEQVGVLVDMARLAFLLGEFGAARHYAGKAKIIADQGQVSLRLRVSAMLIDVLIRIEMAEGSGDATEESDVRALILAGTDAKIVSEASSTCGWVPMGAIAKFLHIRVDFFTGRFHHRIPGCNQFDVGEKLPELDKAIIDMKTCFDCSFSGPMKQLRAKLALEE